MASDGLLAEAADSPGLLAFIGDLEAAGFERINWTTWEGPIRGSLVDRGHTGSECMRIIIRPAWPYLAPLVEVPGIAAWHADQERLCIWHGEDGSQRWKTLDGLLERIDEWAEQATSGFEAVENARNPEIYWEQDCGSVVGLVDIAALVGSDLSDGSHGEFSFRDAVSADGRSSPFTVLELRRGAFRKSSRLPMGYDNHRSLRGRWFYRKSVPHPPRTIEELRSSLTGVQRERLDRDLRTRPVLMYALVWRNGAGLVASAILSIREEAGERVDRLMILRPAGQEALLLRAGPDAATLQIRTVVVVGVGAIGSHVADQLARAGVGRLRIIDHDVLWPVNSVRHAAPPGTPAGTPKVEAVCEVLNQYPWIEVEPINRLVWLPSELRDILTSSDLTVDATGHAGFAELCGRVAHDTGRPLVSVALFRGGSVARVRRQAIRSDTPIIQRRHLDRFLEITPLDDEIEYVGTETGCLAFVHNAPAVSVVRAATLATEVVVDHLTGRHEHDDELLEVMWRADPPFSRLGRVRPEDLPITVDLSEMAKEELLRLSRGAMPAETGGILLGCLVDGRSVVASIAEIADADASAQSYHIETGVAREAIVEAIDEDSRIGYMGEWHSHPSGGDPSPQDVGTMLALAQADDDEYPAKPVLLLVQPSEGDRGEVRAYVVTEGRLVPASICLTGDLVPEQEGEGK